MFNSIEGTKTIMLTAIDLAREMAEKAGIVNPTDLDLMPFIVEALQSMMGADGNWQIPMRSHIETEQNDI
jgi:hypothetical protein